MKIGFDSVQQEVWDTLTALNAAWTQGDADGLIDHFHPEMVAFTASERRRSVGLRACLSTWKRFSKGAKVIEWEEIDPVVRVYGDAAVVSYYFKITFESSGEIVSRDGRDIFVFVRDGGRWLAVANHGSVPPG